MNIVINIPNLTGLQWFLVYVVASYVVFGIFIRMFRDRIIGTGNRDVFKFLWHISPLGLPMFFVAMLLDTILKAFDSITKKITGL